VQAGAWLAAQVKSGLFDPSRLLVDFHDYYNWVRARAPLSLLRPRSS
jgi:hypothetical protein